MPYKFLHTRISQYKRFLGQLFTLDKTYYAGVSLHRLASYTDSVVDSLSAHVETCCKLFHSPGLHSQQIHPQSSADEDAHAQWSVLVPQAEERSAICCVRKVVEIQAFYWLSLVLPSVKSSVRV